MKIGIIGGGIMGISLGYFLSKQGVEVEIYEASPILGGLAGPTTLPDGTEIDRFYHVMLSSDAHLRELCTELNLTDKLHFNQTRTGFYYAGKIHSMNNIVEFLRFPPIGWIDRFRLGLTIIYAQLVNDWHSLEKIDVETWLTRISGKTVYQNIWKPLLRSKFDGSFKDVPATFMWSRLVRMKSTRKGVSQKEEAGHLVGGYQTLVKAMAECIQANGGKIHLSKPVSEVVIENGKATGLRLGDEVRRFDTVISTVQAPVFSRMIPNAGPDYLNFLAQTEYLGVITAILVLDRALSGYWVINLTDENVPFTGVIETTTYIDPRYVGGHHLVYLPKYTTPGSDWQKKSDAEIKQIWTDFLKKMFPNFNESWVRYFLIHRERYVEPLHGLNDTDQIPPVKTPVDNLYLVTTAQIYPALTNSESVTRHAKEAVQTILSAQPKKA